MNAATPILSAETLRNAINEVFTTMIFMNVDPSSPIDEMVANEASVIAAVSFVGKYEGSLTVRCSMACARSITANLLAFEEDEPVEDTDIADAMGEVANMTLGSVKSKNYDIVGELIASAPTVISGQMMEHHLRAGEVRLSTTVGIDDTYCLEVHLDYMDEK